MPIEMKGGGKKCSLKVKRGKRTLHGTVAILAHISDKGGYDAFINGLTIEVSKQTAELYAQKLKNMSVYNMSVYKKFWYNYIGK